MRTKQAKRASVRYLLSVDRRLRRLTLKRLPSIRARTNGSRKSDRLKRVAPVAPGAHAGSASRVAPRALLFAAVFLVAGGALMAAKILVEPAGAGVTHLAPIRETLVPTPEPAPAVVRPSPPMISTAPAPKPRPLPPSTTGPAESAPRSAKRPDASVPSETSESNLAPAPVRAAEAVEAEQPPPITIVGCLEGDGDNFWLKNASGAGVPTSRSWKTGFLKKHTPSMALVDTSQRLNLQGHVGQRVAVTGAVTDRSMHTRALSLIATSCD